MLTLTPHQQQAVDWLVERLTAGQTPVALTGLAGTGKTTVIPALRAALRAHHLPVVVGSPTHRAAMILRSKGIEDAGTIHAHALTPYFQPAYACALDWLSLLSGDYQQKGRPFQACPTRERYEPEDYSTPDGIPLLIADALVGQGRPSVTVSTTVQSLRLLVQRHGSTKALASLAIHGRTYFDGFGPKQGEGVLIIDEASMVGQTTLQLCQTAFPLICLVGDPGQLPPVKDVPALADVAGMQLTEIHRQAGQSPIVALAYAAREGRADWGRLMTVAGEVEEALMAPAAAFLASPLIVWRNTTRLVCTAAIRKTLGYPTDGVVPGEPLVCRATSQEARADGFFNNALYRVVTVGAVNPREVIVQPAGDPDADVLVATIHMEELDGDRVPPQAIPFRFGYCLTAHTAQGGEWPTVYIAKPDLLAYLGRCRQSANRQDQDDGTRWAYTAITRAKQRLVFLQTYTFTQESSMPEHPAIDDPLDDIPDPITPPTVQAALAMQAPVQPTGAGSVDPNTPAGQVVLTVDQALYQFSQHSAMVLTRFRDDAKQVLQGIDGAWKAILTRLDTDNRALTCLKEALQTYAPCTPYSATVHAVTPSGRPVSFTVQDATWDGFMAHMGHVLGVVNMEGWTAPGRSGQTTPSLVAVSSPGDDDIPF